MLQVFERPYMAMLLVKPFLLFRSSSPKLELVCIACPADETSTIRTSGPDNLFSMAGSSKVAKRKWAR